MNNQSSRPPTTAQMASEIFTKVAAELISEGNNNADFARYAADSIKAARAFADAAENRSVLDAE